MTKNLNRCKRLTLSVFLLPTLFALCCGAEIENARAGAAGFGAYDYRNYFADLMDDIINQKQEARPSALKTPAFLNGAAGYEIKSLFSPKWGAK